MPEAGLADLQAWLQARVTAGVWDLAEDPAAGPLAAEVVVSSEALPAKARLAIYARSYGLRLAECLRAEYPVLRAMIGDEVFSLFAGGYLSARPPSAYSLYELGAGFADYLEATRPRPNGGPGAIDAIPASLARLERAIADSSRAIGVEGEAAAGGLDAVAAILPPGARLRTPPTLRLLRMDFDFSDALASVRAGDHPAPPPPGETLVAVARSRYRVRAHGLAVWRFAWLEALSDGADAHGAAQAAARASGRDVAQVLAGLVAWLPSALEAGFVAA
jgi:hypothetical protein